MSYIETPADHAFTAFMASLTPGRVRKDLDANFSKIERKRARYLSEPKRRGRPRKVLPEPFEAVVQHFEGRDRAEQMRDYRVRVKAAQAVADDEVVFEPWQLAVAERVFGGGDAA